MAKRIGSLLESRIRLWACSTIRDRTAGPFARACCFAEFDPWLRSATRDVLRFSLPAQAGIRGYARSPPEPSGETVNTTRKPQYPKPATAKQLLGHASVSQRNDTCSRARPLNGQMNTSVPRRRTTSHPYSKGPKSLEVRRKFGPCGLQECAEMVSFRSIARSS